VDALKERVLELQSQLDSLRDELDERKQENQQLQRTLDEQREHEQRMLRQQQTELSASREEILRLKQAQIDAEALTAHETERLETGLQEQVRAFSDELDHLRRALTASQLELQQARAQHQQERASLEAQLEDAMRRLRPRWQPDLSRCQSCQEAFGLFTRRHHCRACGRCVCDRCSPNQLLLAYLAYRKPQRVCTECERRLLADQQQRNSAIAVTSKVQPQGSLVITEPSFPVQSSSSEPYEDSLLSSAQSSGYSTPAVQQSPISKGPPTPV
jgi:hypothetical protein